MECLAREESIGITNPLEDVEERIGRLREYLDRNLSSGCIENEDLIYLLAGAKVALWDAQLDSSIVSPDLPERFKIYRDSIETQEKRYNDWKRRLAA